jgi:hypothetical protein
LSGDEARCDLAVASERLQPAEARVDLTATAGLHLTNSALTLPDITRGHPGQVAATVRRADDEPGIDVLAAQAVTNVDTATRAVPIIRLARPPAEPTVEEIVQDGQPLLRVDNGWASFQVAPHFAGGIVVWERDGVDHLFTAYPRPDNYAWFGPWYGGIHPYVGTADEQGLPGNIGQLTGEVFHWEALPWRARLARRWCGARLWTEPTVLPWLRVEVEYLTLPGSTLLLATLKLTNNGTSQQPVKAGFNAFVQPGGTRQGARFHWSPDHTPYAPEPFQADWLTAGKWAAVEGAGTTIAATVLSSAVRLEGTAIGESGADIFASARPVLTPGETAEIAVIFALTHDADEARRYRLLAGADL